MRSLEPVDRIVDIPALSIPALVAAIGRGAGQLRARDGGELEVEAGLVQELL
jgi:hypothetical protein